MLVGAFSGRIKMSVIPRDDNAAIIMTESSQGNNPAIRARIPRVSLQRPRRPRAGTMPFERREKAGTSLHALRESRLADEEEFLGYYPPH